MANIPSKAVKKIKNDFHREIAAGILISYGLFPRTNEGIAAAQRLIAGRDTWLAPSDLPNYYNDIDSDLIMGKETAGIQNIRMLLREFYGLNDTEPKKEPQLKPAKPQVNNKPKKEPETPETQIYKPEDKFVDDVTENLDKKLEETSDQMMDVVDALIEKQKKDFEEFKKRQEEERKKKKEELEKGKSQYQEPIGPAEPPAQKSDPNQYQKPIGPEEAPVQGPKEPPVQGPKEPPKKDEEDDDWESEVADQLGTKLDDLLEDVRKDPLPQPNKKKRRRTRGKKKLGRKMPKINGSELGISESLSEIYENVVQTREALFKLYKLNKERFEFKKKVDARLSQMMEAKIRERTLESPKGENEGDGRYSDKDRKKKKKKKSLLRDSLMAGLKAMLLSVALPAIVSGLGLFFSESAEEESREQDAATEEEAQNTEIDDVADGLENPDIPPEEPVLPPPVPEGTDTQPPAPADASTPDTTTQAAPQIQLPDTSIPGDYDYRPTIPAAAEGGKYTVKGSTGTKESLKPLQSKDAPKIPAVTKLTKPLTTAISLPQKAATAGMLSFAKSAISPFTALMPKEGVNFINNIFKDISQSSGITGLDLNVGDSKLEKLFSDLKSMIAKAFTLPADASNIPGNLGVGDVGFGESGGSVGAGPGGSGQDFATLATIAALESGSAQGQADVAQSVYNRLADKTYGSSITEILTTQGQYQVAFKDPTATSGAGTQVADVFKNIRTEDDAVKAIMYYYKARGMNITPNQARKKFREASNAISDPKLQKAAAKHVGGRTEFLSSGQYKSGDAWRGSGSDNTFFARYGSGQQMARGAVAVPEGLFNKPQPTSAPESPTAVAENYQGPVIPEPQKPVDISKLFPVPGNVPRQPPGKGDTMADKLSRAFSAFPAMQQQVQQSQPNPQDLLNNFSATQSFRSITSKSASSQPSY